VSVDLAWARPSIVFLRAYSILLTVFWQYLQNWSPRKCLRLLIPPCTYLFLPLALRDPFPDTMRQVPMDLLNLDKRNAVASWAPIGLPPL